MRPVLFVMFAGLVLAGCAPREQLYIDAAPVVPACTAFGWFLPEEQTETLTDQRVRGEVLRILEAKGYSIDAAEPDCLVAYRLVTRTRFRPGPSVGVGVGGSSGRVGGGVGVNVPVGESSQASGALSIDIIDAARNAQVWSGTLENATRSTEPGLGEISAAATRILAEFPDRAPAP
ncbi:MAG: DUF4136 domain-containing protein [Chromatiales bacterium]|nr:DUF4136 domain-containing protein [Chromatiales bacterium]